MQKQLILVLGALLGSCLPAGGQTLLAPLDLTQDLAQKRSGPGMTLLAASSRDFPLTNVLPARSPAESPARLPVVLAVVHYRNPNLMRPSSVPVEKTQTPFIMHTRISLLPLWGGRLWLDGFASAISMKNLLYGPLSSGDPGRMQPRTAAVYGISLSFRLGRGESLEGSRRCGLLAILFACQNADRIQKSESL
jgi:hypothetical protein